MKIIGVTGKAGAGKTTFSDYLAEKENVAVIHVDEIKNENKQKYFSFIMRKDKNEKKTKVDPKLKNIFYSNKILFRILMKIRAKMVDKTLEKKIEELSKENQIILIDDIFIKHHKIYKHIDTFLFVKRPYEQRMFSLERRDRISKKEAVIYDKAHHKGVYKQVGRNKKILEIDNIGNKEYLKEKADEIYQKEFSNLYTKVINRYKIETDQIITQKQNNISRKSEEKEI